MMLRGENSRDVVRRVTEKVKEINENNILPEGIRIVPYYDRSDIVKASVSTVNKALIEGSILVLIVLYLLLEQHPGQYRGAHRAAAVASGHLHRHEARRDQRKPDVPRRTGDFHRHDHRRDHHSGGKRAAASERRGGATSANYRPCSRRSWRSESRVSSAS